MGYHYSTDILANFVYEFYFDAALQNLHVHQCIIQIHTYNSKCYCTNKLY